MITTSLADRSSFSRPRRISSTGLSSDNSRSSLSAAIPGTFAGDQIHRIRASLLDESEQHFGRNGHTRFIIIPGSRRQTESAGQLGPTVIAKELLANLSETAR